MSHDYEPDQELDVVDAEWEPADMSSEAAIEPLNSSAERVEDTGSGGVEEVPDDSSDDDEADADRAPRLVYGTALAAVANLRPGELLFGTSRDTSPELRQLYSRAGERIVEDETVERIIETSMLCAAADAAGWKAHTKFVFDSVKQGLGFPDETPAAAPAGIKQRLTQAVGRVLSGAGIGVVGAALFWALCHRVPVLDSIAGTHPEALVHNLGVTGAVIGFFAPVLWKVWMWVDYRWRDFHGHRQADIEALTAAASSAPKTTELPDHHQQWLKSASDKLARVDHADVQLLVGRPQIAVYERERTPGKDAS